MRIADEVVGCMAQPEIADASAESALVLKQAIQRRASR
ncbi:hypothetical protein K788_00011325 (plasmid) [Paraburkholderia caribensis MBA4]|uniref:Uncharacterized protein n=1 Tax=Paraburkholderia caribensis MBA4 TaxID=1323664 RepID=A0A0P0RPY3_9BURK|nr:hypothetical protein K788_00011325 [Paraburkholderia caribensis MBA4]